MHLAPRATLLDSPTAQSLPVQPRPLVAEGRKAEELAADLIEVAGESRSLGNPSIHYDEGTHGGPFFNLEQVGEPFCHPVLHRARFR